MQKKFKYNFYLYFLKNIENKKIIWYNVSIYWSFGGSNMENEKKFGTEMFGYDKKEVEEYVKALKADYESKLQAERSDANRVANELSLVKRKLEKYETDYIAKQEKVASALITAEDQAKKIIENSRSEAIQEKDRIEHLIEMEKEKLLDMKREVIDLKEKTVGLLDKYSQEINNLLD